MYCCSTYWMTWAIAQKVCSFIVPKLSPWITRPCMKSIYLTCLVVYFDFAVLALSWRIRKWIPKMADMGTARSRILKTVINIIVIVICIYELAQETPKGMLSEGKRTCQGNCVVCVLLKMVINVNDPLPSFLKGFVVLELYTIRNTGSRLSKPHRTTSNIWRRLNAKTRASIVWEMWRECGKSAQKTSIGYKVSKRHGKIWDMVEDCSAQ